MKKNRLFNLALLLAAVVFAQDSRAQGTSSSTSELAHPDSVALVALYNATNGPNWRDKTNWLSNQPIDEWAGVSTESVGQVYELRLENNRLSGQIPAELGNLANLERLVLSDNQLTGTIPKELGNLTNLERLVLSDNQLTGTIPKELSNLTNLTHLELDDNQLSTLPDSLFVGLASLAVLRLDGNSVDPLSLTISLAQVGTDQVQAVAPVGAPFEIVLPISVTNGSLSGGATTLTILAGSVESAPLTVVRTPGTTAAVTVDIGTLPGPPTNHVGYALVKASDLPLEVISSTVETVGDSGDQQPEQPQQPEAPGGESGTPTLIASTVAPLTEATLDGSVVTLTLSDGTYVRSISDIRDAVIVFGILGVTVDRISRVSDTQIAVELEFNGTDFDTDATLIFTVGANAIADYNKALASRISVTATTESEEQPEQPTVVDRTTFESSTPAGYTEVTLSKTGEVWGGPTQFTDDSDVGTVTFMALGTLKGCSFAVGTRAGALGGVLDNRAARGRPAPGTPAGRLSPSPLEWPRRRRSPPSQRHLSVPAGDPTTAS